MRVRRIGALAGGLLFVLLAATTGVVTAGASPRMHPAQVGTSVPDPTVTTAAPVVTTTTLAPTTTTLPPTTTTAPATTTSSSSTSTSTSTTTTTVATPVNNGGTSNVPWALIVVALVLIAAALIGALIVARRRAAKNKDTWSAAAFSTLRDAELTRDQLEGEARPGQPEDPVRRRTVGDNVNRVAGRLEQLAAEAPNDDAKARASAVATSMRGFLYALTSDELLRSAPQTPTPDQLAAADEARRTRAADLDRSLGDLRAYVDPEGTATQQQQQQPPPQ